MSNIRIAVTGCVHGNLDKVYNTVRAQENQQGIPVDLVLVCGDFQAIRNEGDLNCMSVPMKYRSLGTFWKYYSGELKAPYLTIFIGGNHEASNYLWELYHGGWVAPNIYYLGCAGVVNFRGLRIGGMSGIYNEAHYHRGIDPCDKHISQLQGHFETTPYFKSAIRSVYHVRDYDVQKLMQIQQPIDIFMSHDWPLSIERYGNLAQLLKNKPFFKKEVLSNTLGNPAAGKLFGHLKPDYWFAAHLHVHYKAQVDHDRWEKKTYDKDVCDILNNRKRSYSNTNEQSSRNTDEIVIEDDNDDDNNNDNNNQDDDNNPDEIAIDTSDNEEPNQQDTATVPLKTTSFMSLDKCLPHRSFLQVLDIPSASNCEQVLSYDMEWLSIVRAMDSYLSLSTGELVLPTGTELKSMIEKESQYLQTELNEGRLDMQIPTNFEISAPAHRSDQNKLPWNNAFLSQPIRNEQTETFCKLIGIENKINAKGLTSAAFKTN